MPHIHNPYWNEVQVRSIITLVDYRMLRMTYRKSLIKPSAKSRVPCLVAQPQPCPPFSLWFLHFTFSHGEVQKPQLHLWETFPFLKGGSLLCHHAQCGGGRQHLPEQPLLLLVCFLGREEKSSLGLHPLLAIPQTAASQQCQDTPQSQQAHHESYWLWANTLIKCCSMEASRVF